MIFDQDNVQQHTTVTGYQFSAVKVDDNLSAMEYMLGEIWVDTSPSTSSFVKQLEYCLHDIATMCQKLPTAQNIMIRTSQFNRNLSEIHPQMLVKNIDPARYDGTLHCTGLTALYDATLAGLESSEKFAQELAKQEIDATIVLFILTDGWENCSSKCTDPDMIKTAIQRIRKTETISQLTTCLVGVNAADAKDDLLKFKDQAGFDVYSDIKDATPSSLAKLTNLISQSFSSASQNLGSQNNSSTVNAMTI